MRIFACWRDICHPHLIYQLDRKLYFILLQGYPNQTFNVSRAEQASFLTTILKRRGGAANPPQKSYRKNRRRMLLHQLSFPLFYNPVHTHPDCTAKFCQSSPGDRSRPGSAPTMSTMSIPLGVMWCRFARTDTRGRGSSVLLEVSLSLHFQPTSAGPRRANHSNNDEVFRFLREGVW